MQIDAGLTVLTDFSESINEYSVGAHVYKELPGGTKLGGFVGSDIFSGSGVSQTFYNYGVEGITSFGAFDVEASIGGVAIDGFSDSIGRANVDVYFAVTPAIEISAGVDYLFISGDSLSSYHAAAIYNFQNMPLSIGANYTTSEGSDTFGVRASYAFGSPTNERLFRNHSYSLFLGGA